MSEGMHVTARSTYYMPRKEACLDISELAKVTFTTCHTLKFTHATIDLEGRLLQTVTMRRAYCGAIFASGLGKVGNNSLCKPADQRVILPKLVYRIKNMTLTIVSLNLNNPTTGILVL